MSYRIISWALILFACFYGLGSYPLLDHNEGLYAAVARDMLKSGDFIIPHLNGLPYIEKPPLLYWLTAVSMAAFGENEWAARLVPALALFATAWKLQRFLMRATKSETASLIAPLILVTSLPLLTIGRMVLCDMVMTCFFSMALIFFYEWHAQLHPPGKGQRYLIAFYACLALAAMTKGFVAIILAGGTIAAFLLWQRSPWRDWLKTLSPMGILIFLGILAPWHIAASFKDSGFAWFYFINEHVLRFFNMRQPHDYYTGHFWYYLPRIPAYLIPWTLFLALFAFPSPHRGEARRGAQLTPPKQDGPHPNPPPAGEGILRRFLWSWFLFCLFFFSASGAKANYYMIAGTPPLVMLLALQLESAITTDTRFVRSLASTALILIISTVELGKYLCHAGAGDIYPICQIVTWPVIGFTGVYALGAVALCYRLPPRWIVPLLGSNVLLLLPLLISGVTMAGDNISQKPVAELLKPSDGNIAIYEDFEELSALAFYLDKPLVIVNSQSSDLLYGQQKLPAGNPYFISLTQWLKQSSSLRLVILNKRLNLFMKSVQALHGHACVTQQFDKVSIIGGCN